MRRALVNLCLAIASLAIVGCAAPARSEAQTRAALQAFADTSSTRLNIVADRLARQTDDAGARAALNREKLTVAGMGIDNAMNARAMTGLLDMAFQFDLKARSAQRRVERAHASTRPASAMDAFADDLAAVHAQNRDDVWRLVAQRLSADELRGLRAMIDEWYAKNGDLDRSGVQVAELAQYAGRDPSRTLALSFVDLRDTNEQVDRIVWGAQRLYDNSHWQVRRILFDAIEELERPRDQAIAAVAKAVADERGHAVADAGGLLRRAGAWGMVASTLLSAAVVAAAWILRPRAAPTRASAAGRADVAARIDAIERDRPARTAAAATDRPVAAKQ